VCEQVARGRTRSGTAENGTGDQSPIASPTS